MPQVRKLDPEEVKAYQDKGKGLRKLTEEQYDAMLADFEVGEYGEGTLEEGENRLTVRNRFKAATTRRGVGINFRRTQGDLIRFQIVDGNSVNSNGNGKIGESASTTLIEEPPAPVSSEAPPAPAKRKGGRPKKNPAA